VASDDLPFRAHASRLAACSGLQATPDPFGEPEPPGRHAPLQAARDPKPNCFGLVMACGLATVLEAFAPSPAVELSTSRFRKPTRTTDDTLVFRSRQVAWRRAQVCTLPLTLFGESEPPGRSRYQEPHHAQFGDCSPPTLSCGLATVSRAYAPFPAVELSTSRFRKLVCGVDDLPSQADASRLAACSGLQVTPDSFGESEPPGRLAPLPGLTCRFLTSDCSEPVIACGLAAVSSGFHPVPPPSCSQPHGSASQTGQLMTRFFFAYARSFGDLLRSAGYP